tara:strand:- start:2022 stop:2477 length:456 start_codon:yes stop_codon:yes gene_type:complete
MARITVEDCVDKFPSRFELVLVASQRARKLHSGETPTVEKDNDKNTVIALREIADETISIEEMKEKLIVEYQTVTISDEEDENLEIDKSEDSKDLLDDKSKENLSKDNEIDREIKELNSIEEDDLKEQYEITDNIQDHNNNLDDSSETKDE